MQTVIGLFENVDDADQAVEALMASDIEEENLSVIARQDVVQDVVQDVAPELVNEQVEGENIAKRAGEGALGGGAVGGILGLLVGVGAISIPGVGPAFAAGSLGTAIGMAAGGAGVGAATGTLIGAMLGLGVEEQQAHAYAEGVRRGGILVLVEVDTTRADEVRETLDEAEALDIKELRQTWTKEEGWREFDESTSPEEEVSLT